MMDLHLSLQMPWELRRRCGSADTMSCVLWWFLALIGAVLVWSADSRPISVLSEMSPSHPLQLRLAERFSVSLPQGSEAPDTPTDTPPDTPRSMDLSLDLTFVLLREALQRAVSERLALQASTNQRIMEQIGK
uniref:Corticotropin-releasing factor domain-containing protein n=1 Tax=Neogobius melanostomus TaxID=47308 RepID=A0A8C6SZQ1_9GOBI